MKTIPIYQIDAFASRIFAGNPAAVCPLEAWPEDDLLQAIAQENNLSETAFFVPDKDRYHIRWFTPVSEVDLCGHATLATAFVIFGIDEDPVTGSAHCALTPYWAQKLGKKKLHAHQVSKRGGEIFCEDLGDRVSIGGHAVQFMEGTITI